MRIRYDISIIKKALLLSLGVMVALIILASRSLYYVDVVASTSSAQEESQKNQNLGDAVEQPVSEQEEDKVPQENSGQSQQVLASAEDAIASITPLHIEHVLPIVSEIILSEVDFTHIGIDEKKTLHEFTAYFKVLFRRIISPNAP